jgi:hypothetical protein
MSYTANTAFEARIVNDRFDDQCNIAGKYFVSTTPTDCSAGFLVTRDSLLDCEGFTGVKNENTWKMVAATSSATIDTPVYAADPFDWPLVGSQSGNLYAVGVETLGLGIPAGRYGNFRRIHFDNASVYRIGTGNTSGTQSTNQYLTIDNGTYKWAASAPTTTGAIYFKLMGTGTFTAGTSAAFTYFDVMACKVSTVAG